MLKDNTKHVPGTNYNKLGLRSAAEWITTFYANVRDEMLAIHTLV